MLRPPQSGGEDRVDDRMMRWNEHRHWSVSGVPGTGAQRVGAREAAPRYYATRMQVQEGDSEHDEDATAAANEEGNSEEGADDDQDGDTASESRPDIQARLMKAPGVIVEDTWANRPQRTRVPTNIYQAGTKREVKKPGRGQGRQ